MRQGVGIHRTVLRRTSVAALLLGSLGLGYHAAAQNKVAPPPRPQIGPGESNWVPGAAGPDASLTTTSLAGGLTPTDIVNALVGPGVVVSNISYTGANVAAGTFSGGTGIIGFESGIVLSSGNIASVPGPNTSDGITTNLGLPGDPDLNALIPGFTTFDATVLEFDFECPTLQVISFQYVFTSDEYNEFVNTAFNDVFGFFLNGVNIALIPGTATPVSINNVNCNNPFNPPTGSNCNLYINNDCSDIPPGSFPCAGNVDTEMDGLTVVFTATAPVNPGVNHFKLAIADAGDHILDSNVFLRGQSFVCAPPGACAHTLGFYLNNPGLWPTLPACGPSPGLLLGTNCYDQGQLLAILGERARGTNGIVQLARQLIAAKLNLLACGSCAAVQGAVDAADALIGGQLVPPFGMGFVPITAASPLITQLDEYNNGMIAACP